MPKRCEWCGDDPLYVRYHDLEWGVPCRDERALFELLILEGMQAGLSWITILRKREAFRRAFHGFDPERVARFNSADRDRLLADPGIIRNRAKIAAAMGNARAFLDLKAAGHDFSDWIWTVVDGSPLQNRWRRSADVPGTSPVSEVLSKRLRKSGFKFVGPTICYAFMQSAGLVNDHIVDCPWHAACAALAKG